VKFKEQPLKKMITAYIEIALSWNPKLPNVLSVEMPGSYIFGEGGELYLDENDGTRFSSLWPAIQSFFPKGSTADSNGKTEAWISSWDDDALKSFDGKRFLIRLAQGENENGEFSETAELIA
jgi:hypothetical protein